MRDKLIDLLCDCQHEYDKVFMEAILTHRLPPPERVFLADYLIANGVTVVVANNTTTTWMPLPEAPKGEEE